MEKSQRFYNLVKSGKYLFHLHTVLTDGKITLQEYFEYAQEKQITLIFTEHIRRQPEYDWKEYVRVVHSYGHLAGFEAKILPTGKLDIPDEALNFSDVIGVAVHSFPEDVELTSQLKKALQDYSQNDVPLVWVHPYTTSSEKKYKKEDYIKKVMEGFENKVYLEYNVRKENFSRKEVEELRKRYKIIIGYDIHEKNHFNLILQEPI